MSDPTIHSSSWTGPIGDASFQHGAFTHRLGEPVITSDYQRLLQVEQARAGIPEELYPILRKSALVLISTPVVLWASWVFARAASSDLLIRDNSQLLLAWGAGITALAASQMVCRSQRLLPLREAVLTLALIATIGVAGVYAYGAIRAHAGARATSQERAFARYGISGRGPFRHMVSSHQRADGTDVETGRVEQPLAYSQICERVQRLDGDYGFSWVHVLDRSLPPAHEIAWPIRREDCFSNKPVSSLRG